MTLPGYQARDRLDFRTNLEELYPDVAASSRYTKQGLETFRALSAKCRVHDEAGILKYYRNFLTVATPLLESHRITIDDFNTAFFRGFHPSIQDVIAERFEKVHPHHPVHEPFPMQGVLNAACRHFTSIHFHQWTRSSKGKTHDKHCSHSKRHHDTPDAFIQQTYGAPRSFKQRRSPSPDSDSDPLSSSDSDSKSDLGTDSSSPEYETKSVRFKKTRSSQSQGKDDDDPLDLVTKLQSLSVHEPTYLVLYTQCQKRFPDIAENLPKPQLLPATSSSSSFSYQSTPTVVQPAQPQSYQPPQPSISCS